MLPARFSPQLGRVSGLNRVRMVLVVLFPSARSVIPLGASPKSPLVGPLSTSGEDVTNVATEENPFPPGRGSNGSQPILRRRDAARSFLQVTGSDESRKARQVEGTQSGGADDLATTSESTCGCRGREAAGCGASFNRANTPAPTTRAHALFGGQTPHNPHINARTLPRPNARGPTPDDAAPPNITWVFPRYALDGTTPIRSRASNDAPMSGAPPSYGHQPSAADEQHERNLFRQDSPRQVIKPLSLDLPRCNGCGLRLVPCPRRRASSDLCQRQKAQSVRARLCEAPTRGRQHLSSSHRASPILRVPELPLRQ